jgi:hypothetical protein
LRRFGPLQIGGGHLIVGVGGGGRGDVDEVGLAEQTIERHLIDALRAASEVHRGVQVGAAVLGRKEVVGGVVVASRRVAVGDDVEPEALRGRPEHRAPVVGMGEIDERSTGERS